MGDKMVERTYKYRLYPDREQEEILNRTLILCKNLYNVALDQRKTFWQVDHESVTYKKQADELKDIKTHHPEYNEVYSQVLQDILRRLDKSFRNFFRTRKGYPRFKSCRNFKSFVYPQSGFRLDGNRLKFSKVGNVRIVLHRPIVGKVKTLTVKRYPDRKWYAFFVVGIPDSPVPNYEPKNPVGLDAGLTNLLTLSTGERLGNPKWFRESERRLARAQRELSKRVKGSKRREKQRIKVARLHRKVRDQRSDFQHKLSKFLVSKFDCIVVEDLKIRNMVRNRCLSKSISDAGWNELYIKIAYKAESAGKWYVRVSPNGTTQDCSKCGTVVPKELKDRTHVCPSCGLTMSRDLNASINILRRGLKSLTESRLIAIPLEQRKSTLVETSPSAGSKNRIGKAGQRSEKPPSLDGGGSRIIIL